MQYIHIPSHILHKLDQYQRNFLWGTTLEKKKLHLVKWNDITRPKNIGGLGIQKLRDKNNALLASLAWRLFNSPNAMWAKVILSKYIHTSPINNHSHIWSNITTG